MHCIPGGLDLLHGRVYHNDGPLTRPDSLPYIFRKLRIHKNLTKESVGLKCGVDLIYVDAFEHGYVVPPLKFCIDYGNLFGFNPNWVKVKWANWVSADFKDKLEEGLGLKE